MDGTPSAQAEPQTPEQGHDGPEHGAELRTELSDRWVSYLTRLLFFIAGAGLVGMLVLIVSDVIGIKVFDSPVPGATEFVSLCAVVATAFAVSHTLLMGGHIKVDFIVDYLPRRIRLIVDVLVLLLGVVLLLLLARYSFEYAADLRASGEVTMTQKIPFYPFVYGMAASFVVTLLLLLLDLVKTFRKAVKTWTR